jgi:membrane protease YdiL (CAAX protease family)
LVAPLFWAILIWVTRPAIDLSWPLNAPSVFLMAALAYPVLEELAFRGAAQGALWKTRLAHVNLGLLSGPNLLTSIAFTGLHVWLRPGWFALGVFVPSLIFGYFRDRYQTLLPSILLHSFYNAGFFLLFMNPG